MKTESKRILIIRLSALGDVAMTIPAIYSLARQYPSLHIDVLTRPFFAKLFINAPANVHLICADFKKEYRGLRGMLRLLCRLAKLKPDYVADLHNVMRSWVIDNWFRLRGVKVQMVDKMRSNRAELLCKGTPQPPFIERYAKVFSRLGFPVKLDFVSVFEASKPESPIKVHHPAIGIAPFARYFNKTYPLNLMRQVVHLLLEKGVNVYLFGAPGNEASQLEQIASLYSRCESVAGVFGLEKEMALMSQMDAMVSMDSANQHIASICGIPVVSLWGSTTPACGFAPYRQPVENSLIVSLPCQPCTVAGSPTCPQGHLNCFHQLHPQLIVDKILTII